MSGPKDVPLTGEIATRLDLIGLGRKSKVAGCIDSVAARRRAATRSLCRLDAGAPHGLPAKGEGSTRLFARFAARSGFGGNAQDFQGHPNPFNGDLS
jgi:hypothetical protein